MDAAAVAIDPCDVGLWLWAPVRPAAAAPNAHPAHAPVPGLGGGGLTVFEAPALVVFLRRLPDYLFVIKA